MIAIVAAVLFGLALIFQLAGFALNGSPPTCS